LPLALFLPVNHMQRLFRAVHDPIISAIIKEREEAIMA
jgi:hypothetical protein